MRRDLYFWIASAIILTTVISVALIFLRAMRLPFFMIDILGFRNSITHWFGWTGTAVVLVVTLGYFSLKRVHPKIIRRMLRIHTIGNLIGFLLISIHLAHQVTRSASSYPDLGTGIVQYIAMILLVSSGFPLYFSIRQSWLRYYRFLHPALAMTLLLSLVLHIIHGIQ